MEQQKKDIKGLCSQGWELVNSGDFSEAFSKFNEALGNPYSMGFKAPLSDIASFEGTSLKDTTNEFSSSCIGAWYCHIKMAEKEEDKSWSHLFDAISFAELQRSLEMVETIQLNRDSIGWEATNELIELEETFLQKLEEIKNEIRETNKKIQISSTELSENSVQKLIEKKNDLIEELNLLKLRAYSDWLSFRDEPELHSIFEEYDPWSKFLDILSTKMSHTLGLLYYMIQPYSQELIIIGKELCSRDNAEQAEREISIKFERRRFPLINKLDDLIVRYNIALETRDCNALEKIISKLDEYLLPNFHLSVDLLLVVPDQGIEWIPWELLGASKGISLGLEYGLTKAPSLELFRIIFERRSRMECIQQLNEESKPTAIIFGNPTLDLPNAEDEAEELHNLFETKELNTNVFFGSDATVDVFKKIDPIVDIIHVACHARFHDEDPMLSNLKFSNGNILPRTVEIHNFLHSPITTLNACESGVLRARAGEILGLIRGFIAAGSSSVVATNWEVSDISARNIIIKFYEELLDGKCVGLALKNARKHMHSDEKLEKNAFEWASYTLYGDPYRRLYKPSSEDKEIMIWKLVQSIGGPDEQLSWRAANAIEDIIKLKPDLIKNLLVESIVDEYDDWNPQLTLLRLSWFANRGIIDKKFLKKLLLSAKSHLEEEFYESPNLFYVEEALDQLALDSPPSSKATRSEFNPAIKSMLPDIDITSESGIQVNADDEDKVRCLSRAIDSRDSQLRRAAAEALVRIMDFDYEFPGYASPSSTFCKVLKKALNHQDKSVFKIVFSGIEDNDHWLLSEIGVELIKHILTNPNPKVRRDVCGVLERIMYIDYEFLHDERGVELFKHMLMNPDPQVRKDAVEELVILLEYDYEFILSKVGVELLEHMLMNPAPEVRKGAAEVLAEGFLELSFESSEIESPKSMFRKVLNTALNHKDSIVRRVVFLGFENNEDWLLREMSVELIEHTLSNSDPEVRKDAVEALAALASGAAYDDIEKLLTTASDLLKKASNDSHEGVRKIALESLQDINSQSSG